MTNPESNGAVYAQVEAIEQGVLGCLLLGAPVPPDLPEEAFLDERHKVILDTLRLISREKVEADLIRPATSARLAQRGMLIGVGGDDYLKTLTDHAPTEHNLSYWLPQLMEIYGRRAIKEDMRCFMVSLDDPTVNLDALVSTYRKSLDFIAVGQSGKNGALSVRTPNEILAMSFDDSDRVMGDRLMAKGQNFSMCGPSSVGKSRLVMQQAVAVITGRQFVGFETRGTGLKWLFLQAENSNHRFQFDLQYLKAWVGDRDWPLVNDCIRIHTLENDTDTFLQLDSPSHRNHITTLINDTQPDVIVFDCLYNFQIGDLNKDADMSATLLAISRLCKTGNPNRIPSVLHHSLTGRAGASKATGYDRASFSRNSKILHAWTRGQINVSSGSPTNNDTLVLSCGKCSNGREFESFAVKINPDTRIYEPDTDFDIKAWESDMSGEKRDPTMTPDRVRELCCVAGSSKHDLVKAIQNDCFCSQATAYRHVDLAVKSKTLTTNRSKSTFFRG